MAVVRHLAQGRQVRLSRWGERKYEVVDPATGRTKASWEVSYPVLCELILHRVLDSAEHLAVTDAARDWVAAQVPPARIDHTPCDHPATPAAARRCREQRTVSAPPSTGPAPDGDPPFAPQLDAPALAIALRLLRGHRLGVASGSTHYRTYRLDAHSEVADYQRVSYPAVRQLTDQGVIDRSHQLTCDGRAWLIAQGSSPAPDKH